MAKQLKELAWDRAIACFVFTIGDGSYGHRMTISMRSSVSVCRFRPIPDPGASVDFAEAMITTT